MTSDQRDREEQALEKYRILLNKLEAELPKDASLASIEQAPSEQEKAFMSDTLQFLAGLQALFPRKQRDTRGLVA